jgi:Family of unknown function (DUF5989)
VSSGFRARRCIEDSADTQGIRFFSKEPSSIVISETVVMQRFVEHMVRSFYERKRLWLIPVLLTLLVLSGLIVSADLIVGVAPFSYGYWR